MKTLGVLGRSFAAVGIASAIAVVAPRVANADLLFDRGLPTANLNDAAGSNRSNVAWGDGATTQYIGDNFTLASNHDLVTDIRAWVIGSPVDSSPSTPASDAFTLLLGQDTGATSTVGSLGSFTSTSVSQVTYAGGLNYQGSAGLDVIYQVDFGGISLDPGAGTYAFGIGGPPGRADINTPFLSASNGLLSGSTQQGDDGLVYGFTAGGIMDAGNGYPFDSSIVGWDKNSDVNVQVFGQVPEPSDISLSLTGLGVLAVVLFLRRRRSAAAA